LLVIRLIIIGLAVIVLSACDDAPEVRATLALELDEMKYELREDGRNTYHHNRRFVETAGIGVTLLHGEVCVETKCEEAEVRYRIEPKSSFIQAGHYVATLLHVATLLPADVITFSYSGVDDAVHPVVVRRTLNVKGTTFTLD
jgi:hypothetical protein